MPVTINGTTGFTFPNGSAGTPSLTGVDTDTGIFFGSDTIAFTEGGTEALRIDGLGNVGLGTTTVSGFHNRIFHMHGSASAEIHLTTTGTGTGASDGLVLFRRDSDGLCGIINRESSSLTLGTADQDRLTISSTGNVGIGTTNPNNNAILDVRGTQYIVRNAIYSSESNPGLYIRNNASVGSSGLILGCDSTINAAYIQPLLAGTTYSHNLVICAMGGGVGIGVTSPDSLLHVGQSSAGGTVAARIQNSNTAADSDAALYLQTPNATYTLKAKRTGVRCDFEIDGTPKISINAISGNVGIGLTNPDSLLHLRNLGGDCKQTIESANASSAYTNYSAQNSEFSIGYLRNSGTDATFRFCAGNDLTSSEVMRIDAAYGNVGIGTTGSYTIWPNTSRKLELSGPGGSVVLLNTTSANANAKFIGGIDFANYASGVGAAESALIGCYQDGTHVANPGGSLRFFTRQDGGSLSERVSIIQDGKVGIGVTNPTYMLHMGGGTYLPQLFHAPEYSVRAGSVNSTGNITFSFTFATAGGSGTYLVTAASSHYGNSGYYCMRQSYMGVNPGAFEINLHNYTTATHGSWSFTWSGNVLTVTHNAGSYNGGANFWVVVQGG